METGIKKNQIIAELTRSPHGDLKSYVPIAQRATVEEPEFLAHLIAWNHKNGQIRDSKVAIPAITLSRPNFVFVENSLAHMASLDPRNFVRALRFAKEIKTPTHGKSISALVEKYIRHREANQGFWDKTVVQHKASMKTLYGMYHIKPSSRADKVLFKGLRPKGSVFEVIHSLKDLAPTEAAGLIVKHRIPWLAASGALGAKLKEPDVVMALIAQMTATELVTNTKMLEKLGIKTNPALRSAYELGLKKVADSKKATFKTSTAAAQVTDEKLKAKLQGAQEKQIDTMAKVKGNWLVLGDKSGSMQHAIKTAIEVSATLTRVVEGEVHLVFFDESPRYLNATGKTLYALNDETRHVTAGGGTNIGCGLQYLLDKGIEIDGIAVVSDGGENGSPRFASVYTKYCAKFGKDVPVYFYKLHGSDGDTFSGSMKQADADLQTFDLTGGLDYYSLPNIVQTMRASRFSLVDTIMETKLLTLNDIFEGEEHVAIAA